MRVARWLLPGWTLIILWAGVLPLSDFKGHSHWDHVEWIPYTSPVNNALDDVGNVALFAPFGYLAVRAARSQCRWTVVSVVAAAALLSLGIEWYQVYCHNHFPSASDVVNNAAGAALGAVWGRRRAQSLT